ncbi:anhydro-N-acetylmuramic acid kinase [Xanthomonas sacchari]|uniref:Anhydro-N-acetylmuramic acid kinase n=1 Tax=Xanthomonas sacchari TaxID=56458 RepID=A0A2P5Z4C3_9XANT|nr:anhydro-N-acetylmuramic acid kinase [Xanthomonas sacchari]MDV0438724.1 anhydro-N-acetylmuramic acid kinase [Xanthomonas sacchari]PPU82635.1 anhydro-N-acetylmuramic acid kinase [Xanthomonas sacchari]
MSSPSAVPDDALFLGLMSGTSADGIDAALVRFGHDGNPQLQLGRTYVWAPQQRAALIALGEGGDIASLDALGQLDAEVAIAFAEAALRLLDDAGVAPAAVRAIGSHGQTVRHRPLANPAFTWQLGDGNRIAELTGIATVCDFRRRDVAAGGHGAPLMPAFHAAMLGAAHEDRAVLNLGGIGNLTLLPAHGAVRGFDTGPANALLDAWCQRHRGQPYDAGGAFAASGAVDANLLQRLLADPWFALPPPKSTGREQFHLRWLEACLDTPAPAPASVQATLLELTAATVADALLAQQPATRQLLVCGGGVHNPLLLARLQARLPGVQVQSTQAQGLDPDYIEAMGFAWLARQTLAGLPGNLPSVSGARGPRILGAIHPA